MDTTTLDSSKSPPSNVSDWSWPIFAQLVFGALPAAVGVLLLLLVASGESGNHAWAYRVHALLGFAGFVGLILGAVPPPHWAAWPKLALLFAGYAAVAMVVWPASLHDLRSSLGILAFISPIAAGPVLVGAYQAIRSIRGLRAFRKARRNVA